MVKKPSSGTRIYVDEYPWSSFLNSASLQVTQQTPDVTCFEDEGPRRVVDNYDHSQSHAGVFDPDDDSFDEQAWAALSDGADHYILHLYEGSAVGKVAYESISVIGSEPLEASTAQAILRSIEASGSNSLSRGLVMLNQTVTEAVDGTGQNQGTTDAGTEYQMVVRVISGTFDSITVAIEESSDGDTDPYAAITGLEITMTDVGVERDSVVIATEAYKRAAVTAFTGTSAVVLVTAGVVAGTE